MTANRIRTIVENRCPDPPHHSIPDPLPHPASAMSHKLLAPAIVLAALLMAPLPPAAATPIYKCVVKGTVTYQGDPCPSGVTGKHPTVEQLNTERQNHLLPARNSAAAPSPPVPGGANPSRPGAASGSPAPNLKTSPAATVVPAAPPAALFKCDGRRYCSQMTSCEEATLFLAHCPAVRMDGNHDGVPCEKQWCKS